MSSNERYPARVEQFHAVAVTIYEIDGKDYLTAEDIGRCLGLAEPAIAVNKIYRRNREELESHKAEVKDATLVYPSSGKDGRGGGPQATRLFTETGANLIGMFSRTAKSKDFRLWLARLPRRPDSGRAHRALADAEVTAHLLLRMLADLRERHAALADAEVDHALLCTLQRTPRQQMARVLDLHGVAVARLPGLL